MTNKLYLQKWSWKGYLSIGNSKLTGIENLRERHRKRQSERQRNRDSEKLT